MSDWLRWRWMRAANPALAMLLRCQAKPTKSNPLHTSLAVYV